MIQAVEFYFGRFLSSQSFIDLKNPLKKFLSRDFSFELLHQLNASARKTRAATIKMKTKYSMYFYF